MPSPMTASIRLALLAFVGLALSATAEARPIRVTHATCGSAQIGHKTVTGSYVCRSALEFCRAYETLVGGVWKACTKVGSVQNICRGRNELVVLMEGPKGEDLRYDCEGQRRPLLLEAAPAIVYDQPNYNAGCCEPL